MTERPRHARSEVDMTTELGHCPEGAQLMILRLILKGEHACSVRSAQFLQRHEETARSGPVLVAALGLVGCTCTQRWGAFGMGGSCAANHCTRYAGAVGTDSELTRYL